MQPFKPDEIKIALIGGGTGSFTLLSALKNHTSQIAALVNMADDGGSTGLLRDELGALPPGDVRQCLIALSQSPEIRDLFNYRFDVGSMQGHAFGNIFLSAIEKMTGDFAKAVEVASRILNITGIVVPITLSNVRLMMQASNGKSVRGQHVIEVRDFKGAKPKMWLEPTPVANSLALEAIKDADMVVIAPGNLYASLAPALIVPGIGEALKQSKALKVYVTNLMTKPGQTDNYQVQDFANEIERFAAEEFLDVVLYNTEKPSAQLIKKYAKDGELPVDYDVSQLKKYHYKSIGYKMLSGRAWSDGQKSDPLASSRTLIRHDSEAVAKALVDIYERLA